MNRSGRRAAFIFLLAVTAMWAFSPVAGGQSVSRATGTTIIDVEGPRPLADVIRELERRHGWVVTYEEVPYEYAGDLVDVARSVRKYGDLSIPVLVPKGGRLSFAYPEPLPNGKNEEAVLQDLLRQYRASGLPGEFGLARSGEIFHVIPRTSRNALGVEEGRHSALDARISIPEGDRTVDEMLTAIELAIYTETGWAIAVGGPVWNLFLQSRLVAGADKESARSVLLRTLHATRRQVSWQLFCGPAGTANPLCAVNFNMVDRPPANR